ncbi:MAG: hypothetical protein ACC618_04165, partial [Patescibacteria group bacterium]
MNKNSRGLVPILIILVLALIGVVYAIFRSTSTPSPSPSPTPSLEEIANWKTFRYTRYLFEFKYPSNWSLDVSLTDSKPEPIEIKDEKKELVISISSFDPNTVGISYCEATPKDKKCETLVTEGGIWVTINWDLDGKAYAIFDGTSVTLEKVTRNTKQIFRQILSTFKFLDDNSETTQPFTGEGCVVGGCNGELCQDADEEPLASICIFRPEYECYKSASCKHRANSKCGWTQTEELKTCLSQYQN